MVLRDRISILQSKQICAFKTSVCCALCLPELTKSHILLITIYFYLKQCICFHLIKILLPKNQQVPITIPWTDFPAIWI